MTNTDIILMELIGGGSLDWKYLDDCIDRYDLDPYDVVYETKDLFFDKQIEFNDLMYITLYLGFFRIRDFVLDKIDEYGWNIKDEIKKWIENAEFSCFVNYLDSFITAPVFSDYDIYELKNKKQLAHFIADVWKKIK